MRKKTGGYKERSRCIVNVSGKRPERGRLRYEQKAESNQAVAFGLGKPLPPINMRQFLMRAIPFIILFYIGDKFAWLYQYCQGQTALVRLFNLLANCQMAFQPPWFSFAAEHMLAGLILSGTVLLIMTHRSRNAKKVSPWHGIWLRALGDGKGHRALYRPCV